MANACPDPIDQQWTSSVRPPLLLVAAALFYAGNHASVRAHTVSLQTTTAVFTSSKKYYANKRFSVTSNLRYMHGVLNVDEIKKLIVQLSYTLRDERFEPN
jgi:hypothetical protein